MEQKEMALLGKIAAGLSHEMKNVLAIINESAGLVEDICVHSGKGLEHMDKVERAVGSIQKQIDKGADITTKFNKFAHSMDTEFGHVTANEVVEQVVFLMHRFALQKQIELVSKPMRKDKGFTTRPVHLILALCAWVNFYLEGLTEAKEITLTPEKSREGISFDISIEGRADRETGGRTAFAELPEMKDILSKINAEIRPLKSQEQPGLKMVIFI